MPQPTFFRLPDERRQRLVDEAVVEFAERSYHEASLSEIARRSRIPKGSFYQYFDGKLDLYRWLITEEAPRRKRAFLGEAGSGDFWSRLETFVERGVAFLVEHPRFARLSAAAADPSADAEVRELHGAICEAGIAELRALLERGMAEGAITRTIEVDVAARFVSSIIGPGLTDVILHELGAELHEVLASDTLRRRLDATRRTRLARQAVGFIRSGLAPAQASAQPSRPRTTKRR